jgi:anti-sigma regulatory factor (Ser/Thr protein kinase)
VDVPVQGLYLDLERTINCGLLVNELLTNALKHAFPSGGPGEVGVRLQRTDTTVTLEAWDRGKGLPPDLGPARGTSLGLRLVHILSRRLQATLTVEHDNGTRFAIRFPLDAVPPRRPAARLAVSGAPRRELRPPGRTACTRSRGHPGRPLHVFSFLAVRKSAARPRGSGVVLSRGPLVRSTAPVMPVRGGWFAREWTPVDGGEDEPGNCCQMLG